MKNRLHLEDSSEDVDLIKATISGEGIDCEIILVDSRKSLLTSLDQRDFDVIPADCSVTSLDGLSALRRVGRGNRDRISEARSERPRTQEPFTPSCAVHKARAPGDPNRVPDDELTNCWLLSTRIVEGDDGRNLG